MNVIRCHIIKPYITLFAITEKLFLYKKNKSTMSLAPARPRKSEYQQAVDVFVSTVNELVERAKTEKMAILPSYMADECTVMNTYCMLAYAATSQLITLRREKLHREMGKQIRAMAQAGIEKYGEGRDDLKKILTAILKHGEALEKEERNDLFLEILKSFFRVSDKGKHAFRYITHNNWLFEKDGSNDENVLTLIVYYAYSFLTSYCCDVVGVIEKLDPSKPKEKETLAILKTKLHHGCWVKGRVEALTVFLEEKYGIAVKSMKNAMLDYIARSKVQRLKADQEKKRASQQAGEAKVEVVEERPLSMSSLLQQPARRNPTVEKRKTTSTTAVEPSGQTNQQDGAPSGSKNVPLAKK